MSCSRMRCSAVLLELSGCICLLAAASASALQHFRAALSLVICLAAWRTWRVATRSSGPRDHLMELAAGIHGQPPAELLARSERIAAKKQLAKPPPTQEQELALLDTSPAPHFRVDDPAWLTHLDTEGYAVVADVVSAAELERAEDLLWQFLEACSPWRRQDPNSWTDEGLAGIGSVQNGIVNGAGVGQSDFLWFLRTRPLVRQAFERIWSTSELLVSFDVANIFRPWHHGFRKTVAGWWHVDQGGAKTGRHAVQGFVSLYSADGRTGGLTVVPRSHLRHAEVVEDQQNPEVDYCTVQSYCALMQELPRRLVCCKPGDLVLWDSRTVHANSPAPEQPVGPPNRLLRAVAYVCMTPKSFAPQQVREGRRSAFEHGLSTSHWPHKLDLGSVGATGRPLSLAPPEVAALVG
eukprot:CAMPEP_0115069976 /NCGR_PEP_ID=MMETSP0227-20121206/12853_1 /TAXON_ID=89957 /ORGANISM="Polarella glacialis, Strain CCMP 1383" /LENGTH=407 /DNA_ID=CAMNT_0002456431 /DNA_START=33 /DNA_END=1256 /DNA_ORIENTATION=+